MKKWQCIVCGYTYDEAVGDPEHGIRAGTRPTGRALSAA